jgi:hypothetical protein
VTTRSGGSVEKRPPRSTWRNTTIIRVIKAGEIHSFKVVGDGPLVQEDVHVSPRFIQENLPVG